MKNGNRSMTTIILLVGFVVSILAWFLLAHQELNYHLFDSLVAALPWIVLFLGLIVTILVAFGVRLAQLTHQRAKDYRFMNENFQKEINERTQAEKTKLQLEKALQQGQKLQAMGTLAGGIAHDFNNILYAVIGYVQMARDDVPEDSLLYKNLGKVLEGCQRGQDLVARILAFSRRQHHEFKPIELKATVEGVLSLLRPTIPASVELELNLMKDDFIILGNQTHLHQIVVNIINNAIDAMDGEGTIMIELSRVTKDDELKNYPKMDNRNYCKICISDTGHGMDQATMERIFEPFFTTKEVGKGTGLGLATAHAIVNEHEGHIMVTSQLGRGTMFTLLLPEYQGEKNGEDIVSRR